MLMVTILLCKHVKDDLVRSPQFSEGRVPKKWSAIVFKQVSKQKPIKTVDPWSLGRPNDHWRSPCLARPLELWYSLCRSIPRVVRSIDGV